MATFRFNLQTAIGETPFEIDTGSSIYFVGANGAGKTRLAVKIEADLQLKAHRISAHRALTLNPQVQKISETQALNGLLIGLTDSKATVNTSSRNSYRWKNSHTTFLLNDFDRLLQYLFAEQNNIALKSHKQLREGETNTPNETKFEKLKSIWEHLIKDRTLEISADDIVVKNGSESYGAGNMSDGERAIFYLIGQVLAVPNETAVIIDEPELHVHKAIISKLWDALEAARPDCAFIFIPHDLDFVASRVGKKYAIKGFTNKRWDIEEIIPDSGFSEEMTTKILGSRRPVLFVEGDRSSLDIAIYRSCYPEWTVIPVGSCESVIHAVTTMRKNPSLTRITCSGIVDADDYDSTDIHILKSLGIEVLPVSEIENIFLLPTITKVIGEHEGYSGSDLIGRINSLKQDVYNLVLNGNNLEDNVASYCKRRIDRILKKIDLSTAKSVTDISTLYATETTSLDILKIADKHRTAITKSISEDNISALMKLYDNKGLLALVASHLKSSRSKDFESWLVRVLSNETVPNLLTELKLVLPSISPL